MQNRKYYIVQRGGTQIFPNTHLLYYTAQLRQIHCVLAQLAWDPRHSPAPVQVSVNNIHIQINVHYGYMVGTA